VGIIAASLEGWGRRIGRESRPPDPARPVWSGGSARVIALLSMVLAASAMWAQSANAGEAAKYRAADLAGPFQDLLDGIHDTVRLISLEDKEKFDKIVESLQNLLDSVEQNDGVGSPLYNEVNKQLQDAKEARKTGLAAEGVAELLAFGTLVVQFDSAEEVEYETNPDSSPCHCIGQTEVDGVPTISRADQGQTVSLTFNFSDIVTGIPPTSGPAIGSVLYEVNLDPLVPTVFDPIGISFDASGGFAEPFTIGSYEPLIVAIPFDPSGAPIFVSGFPGENIAPSIALDIPTDAPPVPLPEPRIWAMMLLGLGTVGAVKRYSRRRCRTAPSGAQKMA
jgi:hypothetical protein